MMLPNGVTWLDLTIFNTFRGKKVEENVDREICDYDRIYAYTVFRLV